MRSLTQRAHDSVAFYPVTATYIVGVLVAAGMADGLFGLTVGLACLTAIVFVVVIIALIREVRIVHLLVNSQHDALLERIAELSDALVGAGIEPPPRNQGVKDAEQNAERVEA